LSTTFCEGRVWNMHVYLMNAILALDANTSNVRAILVGLQSNILASSSVPLAMESPKSGRVKQ
jgi:sugar (pentulose or hexulose) kinase